MHKEQIDEDLAPEVVLYVETGHSEQAAEIAAPETVLYAPA